MRAEHHQLRTRAPLPGSLVLSRALSGREAPLPLPHRLLFVASPGRAAPVTASRRVPPAAVAATIALIAPAAAHAATPSPPVQAQITAQQAVIGGYDAAIKSIQACTLGTLYSQRAIAQAKLAQLLATP